MARGTARGAGARHGPWDGAYIATELDHAANDQCAVVAARGHIVRKCDGAQAASASRGEGECGAGGP